jgi:hypothetical protein
MTRTKNALALASVMGSLCLGATTAQADAPLRVRWDCYLEDAAVDCNALANAYAEATPGVVLDTDDADLEVHVRSIEIAPRRRLGAPLLEPSLWDVRGNASVTFRVAGALEIGVGATFVIRGGAIHEPGDRSALDPVATQAATSGASPVKPSSRSPTPSATARSAPKTDAGAEVDRCRTTSMPLPHDIAATRRRCHTTSMTRDTERRLPSRLEAGSPHAVRAAPRLSVRALVRRRGSRRALLVGRRLLGRARVLGVALRRRLVPTLVRARLHRGRTMLRRTRVQRHVVRTRRRRLRRHSSRFAVSGENAGRHTA